MDIPDLHTWVDGEVPDADLFNATLGRSVRLLRGAPRVQARRTATQSITSHASNMYAVSFDGKLTDTDNMLDLAGAPTRLTCVTPGYYRLSGQVGWAGSSSDMRRCRWYKNGTGLEQLATEYPGGANAVTKYAPTILTSMAIGDYLELMVGQGTGSGLNISGVVALAQWVAAS